MASNRFNGFKSPCGNFKSPMQVRGKMDTPESIKEDVHEFRHKLDNLDKEINLLLAEGCKEEELKVHIDKMHEYNEIKDVCQMVLGRIENISRGNKMIIGVSDVDASSLEAFTV